MLAAQTLMIARAFFSAGLSLPLIACSPLPVSQSEDVITAIVIEPASPDRGAQRWRVTGKMEPDRIADYFDEVPLRTVSLEIHLPDTQFPDKPVIEETMTVTSKSESWNIQGEWRIEFSGYIYCRPGDAIAKRVQGDPLLGCEDIYGKLVELRFEVRSALGSKTVARGQFRMPAQPQPARRRVH